MAQALTTTPPTECGIAEYSQHLYDGFDTEIRVLGDGTAWSRGSLLSASRAARQVAGDLLHVQHEWLMYGDPKHNAIPLFALAANRARGGRNITTMHTVIPPDAVTPDFLERFGADGSPPFVVRAAVRRLTKAIGRLSDRVVVHTEGAAECLRKDYDFTNVHVIPHGLTPRPRHPIRDPVKFLYIGLVNRGKGVDVLLEALDRIPEQPEIDIVGRVEDKSLHDPRITDQFLDEADYRARIEAADVLVLPYVKGEYHAASGVLADALAHGKGVIVTDIPQLTADVTDSKTGLVIERDNPQALSEALMFATHHPLKMEAMAARFYERAHKRAWPEVQSQTTALYQHVS